MPITPTSRKKLLETARKNSVEARLRARIKKDHLHERDLDFLKRVVETVDYMRSKGKSEDEIRQHLRETKEKHALFGELLRNWVNIMGPRFNLFKRKSAAEKTAQKHQEAINHMCEVYGLPAGTQLAQIKTKLEAIKDPAKKRIAIGKLDDLLREIKRNRNQ